MIIKTEVRSRITSMKIVIFIVIIMSTAGLTHIASLDFSVLLVVERM
jgi:hypothetical protein